FPPMSRLPANLPQFRPPPEPPRHSSRQCHAEHHNRPPLRPAVLESRQRFAPHFRRESPPAIHASSQSVLASPEIFAKPGLLVPPLPSSRPLERSHPASLPRARPTHAPYQAPPTSPQPRPTRQLKKHPRPATGPSPDWSAVPAG